MAQRGRRAAPRPPRAPWLNLQAGILVAALVALLGGAGVWLTGSSGEAHDDQRLRASIADPPALPSLRGKPIQGVRFKRTKQFLLAQQAERLRRLAKQSIAFRVSSFNILGHNHTIGSKRYAAGTTRVRWAVDLIRAANISVVGLQEFQPEQAGVFRGIAGEYATYPTSGIRESQANSIAWRTSEWELVDAEMIDIPYFGGRIVPMPMVQLKFRDTGRTVWFANFHNPADAHGNAQGWRNEAMRRQNALANRVTADGSPLVFTGDFNERDEFFCSLTLNTSMHAANGGSTGAPCRPPARMDVDWVMGSANISFTNFTSDRSALVARTTDHPFVWADATVAEAPTG